MDYIIEIHGFRDVNKGFLPKEVAVVTVDHGYYAHWMLEAPCPFSDLHEKERTVNNYVTCYHHGIEWFKSDISLKILHANLREIAGSACRILTRGHEKARFLEAVTSRRVVNLEFTDCPSFDKLDSPNEYCLFHGVKKEELYSCALNNAVKSKKWVSESKILRGYDYPAHVELDRGKCEFHNNQPIPSFGLTRNAECKEAVREPRQELQQQAPPPPERKSSNKPTSSQLPTPPPTPPRTPTKPPPCKANEFPDSTTPTYSSCDKSEPLDLSTRLESLLSSESSDYGMTVSENAQDEQSSNS